MAVAPVQWLAIRGCHYQFRGVEHTLQSQESREDVLQSGPERGPSVWSSLGACLRRWSASGGIRHSLSPSRCFLPLAHQLRTAAPLCSSDQCFRSCQCMISCQPLANSPSSDQCSSASLARVLSLGRPEAKLAESLQLDWMMKSTAQLLDQWDFGLRSRSVPPAYGQHFPQCLQEPKRSSSLGCLEGMPLLKRAVLLLLDISSTVLLVLMTYISVLIQYCYV